MDQHIDYIISELNALKEELINNSYTIEKKNDSDNNNSQNNCSLKPIRRRTNRSFPLNRSKFLNEEQRDQVLQFASDNKEEIMNQPRSNRIPYLQNLVYNKLDINLSLYMAGKVIQIISVQ